MRTLLHESTRHQIDTLRHARSESVIFHGPRGIGKATAAYELARELNCQGDEGGACAACRRFAAGSYPDFIIIQPEDKPSVTIEQVRGLTAALSLSLYSAGGMRVVVIDQAEALTIEAQNALLKLIEEPPPQTLFILIAEYPEALLPTVRSRCASIYFAKVTRNKIVRLLEQTHGLKPAAAAALADTAAGLPGLALGLAASPDTAAAQAELSELAASAPKLGLFERLLLAKRLVDSKTDLSLFARFLHASLVASLCTGAADATAAHGLEALERFRQALRAKVAPRVAVERLMLEL